eukprot:PLAT3022.1.p1 GENE.PLAT3022.1~~PLAT3022.1.p1  ORF type:complete len:130 (-),score=25.41 PLAT3022.1:42-383(-)
MLYPREVVHDAAEVLHGAPKREMMWACRHCDWETPAEEFCIHRVAIERDTSMSLDIIRSDIVEDPTLPRDLNAVCPKCGPSKIVYFQSSSYFRDESLKLIFVCCKCAEKWTDT